MPMMGWWYGYMPYFGTGVLGFIITILFWILIVWLILSLLRGDVRTGLSGNQKKSSAINILEERYARGEIDKKEFEEKLADLTKKAR